MFHELASYTTEFAEAATWDPTANSDMQRDVLATLSASEAARQAMVAELTAPADSRGAGRAELKVEEASWERLPAEQAVQAAL